MYLSQACWHLSFYQTKAESAPDPHTYVSILSARMRWCFLPAAGSQRDLDLSMLPCPARIRLRTMRTVRAIFDNQTAVWIPTESWSKILRRNGIWFRLSRVVPRRTWDTVTVPISRPLGLYSFQKTIQPPAARDYGVSRGIAPEWSAFLPRRGWIRSSPAIDDGLRNQRLCPIVFLTCDQCRPSMPATWCATVRYARRRQA